MLFNVFIIFCDKYNLASAICPGDYIRTSYPYYTLFVFHHLPISFHQKCYALGFAGFNLLLAKT